MLLSVPLPFGQTGAYVVCSVPTLTTYNWQIWDSSGLFSLKHTPDVKQLG